jgi:hypothetical protein
MKYLFIIINNNNDVAALVKQKSAIMVVTYSLATNLKPSYLCDTMPSNMTSSN